MSMIIQGSSLSTAQANNPVQEDFRSSCTCCSWDCVKKIAIKALSIFVILGLVVGTVLSILGNKLGSEVSTISKNGPTIIDIIKNLEVRQRLGRVSFSSLIALKT